MNVKIKVYDMNKYRNESKKIEELRYRNIKRFEVVEGEKALKLEIENNFSVLDIDDFHEYLILTLENDKHVIFRNSFVDLFNDER